MTVGIWKRFAMVLALVWAAQPQSLWACAACYGQSDAPMAAGMNWGIMSLLVMIALVLVGVASFFVYLARRSAALAKQIPAEELAEANI